MKPRMRTRRQPLKPRKLHSTWKSAFPLLLWSVLQAWPHGAKADNSSAAATVLALEPQNWTLAHSLPPATIDPKDTPSPCWGPCTRKGELRFAELQPGDQQQVNPFHQFKGSRTETKASFVPTLSVPPLELRLSQGIHAGEIIDTGEQGRVRLLVADDSLLDLAPQTRITLAKVEQSDKARQILIRILQGSLRILVTRKLEGRSTYQVSAPGALISVRGTDFLVHVEPYGDQLRTDVFGIRGQITVDIPKLAQGGTVYTQPFVVKTHSHLRVFSANGMALHSQLRENLSMAQRVSLWENMGSPAELELSPLGRHPSGRDLPGTGLARNYLHKSNLWTPPETPRTDLQKELEDLHPEDHALSVIETGNFEPLSQDLLLKAY